MRLHEFAITETTEEIQDIMRLARAIAAAIQAKFNEDPEFPVFHVEFQDVPNVPKISPEILNMVKDFEFDIHPPGAFDDRNKTARGTYDHDFKDIYISSKIVKNTSKLISVLVHELQHMIDVHKDPTFRKRYKYKTDDEYLRLSQEINARFTQVLYNIVELVFDSNEHGEKLDTNTIMSNIEMSFSEFNIEPDMFKNKKQYQRLLSRAYKFCTALENATDLTATDPARQKNRVDTANKLLDMFDLSDKEMFARLMSKL